MNCQRVRKHLPYIAKNKQQQSHLISEHILLLSMSPDFFFEKWLMQNSKYEDGTHCTGKMDELFIYNYLFCMQLLIYCNS